MSEYDYFGQLIYRALLDLGTDKKAYVHNLLYLLPFREAKPAEVIYTDTVPVFLIPHFVK